MTTIVLDKDALKSNLSLIEGMCKTTRELVDTPNIELSALINFCNQILGSAHWMVHTSFVNIPSPEPPEPLKELQEE